MGYVYVVALRCVSCVDKHAYETASIDEHSRHSALQRWLESSPPSASLVLGDLLAHFARLCTTAAGASIALEVDRHGEVDIESSVPLFDADSLLTYCATKGRATSEASLQFVTPHGIILNRPVEGAGFDTVFRLSDSPLVLCGELCFRSDSFIAWALAGCMQALAPDHAYFSAVLDACDSVRSGSIRHTRLAYK